MVKAVVHPAIALSLGALGAACLLLLMAQGPARAAADPSNFNVRNCTNERIFVCSFDKNDDRMKIPYKAAGIQPNKRKEFGCASLGRCKVIIGVSNKRTKRTLSSAMQAALSAGSVGAAAIAGASAVSAAATTSGTTVYEMTKVTTAMTEVTNTTVAGESTAVSLTAIGVTAGVFAVVAGGGVAAVEVMDGWSDGEVCNQVRRAAEKAGMKPRDFMQDSRRYVVVEQYAVNDKGKPYLNADGTAVFAYKARRGDSCPAPLKAELVRD